MIDHREKLIAEVSLTTRTLNVVVKDMGLRTLGQLADASDAEFLRQRNFGRKSLNEVREMLRDHGLSGPDLVRTRPDIPTDHIRLAKAIAKAREEKRELGVKEGRAADAYRKAVCAHIAAASRVHELLECYLDLCSKRAEQGERE